MGGAPVSYNVWLEADLGGPTPITLDCDWSSTSNCVSMWCLAGADLAEFDGRPAGECIPALAEAIKDMRANPGRYTPLNPPNGWGSLDTLIPALQRLLGYFQEAPKATVRVGR